MTTEASGWRLTERGFDPAQASYYEAVMTVGNGRLGTRASLEEGHLGSLPGTYLAGVYDAHDAPVIDLVNVPGWLDSEVWVDGCRLDVDTLEILDHDRTLDLRTGVLRRSTTFAHPRLGPIRLTTARIASMADRDLCAQRLEVTPLESDAEIRIVTGIDVERRNLDRLPAYAQDPALTPQRKWEKWARSNHLKLVDRHVEARTGLVSTETIDSGVRITVAFQVSTSSQPTWEGCVETHGRIGTEWRFSAAAGQSVAVEKQVAYATSRDPVTDSGPCSRALATLERHRPEGFDDLLAASAQVWA